MKPCEALENNFGSEKNDTHLMKHSLHNICGATQCNICAAVSDIDS